MHRKQLKVAAVVEASDSISIIVVPCRIPKSLEIMHCARTQCPIIQGLPFTHCVRAIRPLPLTEEVGRDMEMVLR
jgi:hypothetical protein